MNEISPVLCSGSSVQLVATLLKEVSFQFDMPFDEKECRLWMVTFSHVRPEDLREAVRRCLQTARSPRKIENLSEAVREVVEANLMRLRDIVVQAANEHGTARRKFLVFPHACIHRAIVSFGSWTSTAEELRDMKNRSFARHRVLEELRSTWLADSTKHVCGFGEFDGSNVVLIGERSEALSVYSTGYKGPVGQMLGVTSYKEARSVNNLPIELKGHHFYSESQDPFRVSDLTDLDRLLPVPE